MNKVPHKIVLTDLKNLLLKIDSHSFVKKNKNLSEGSIGEHFRHIIEFYQCCFLQKESRVINYDLRKRNKELEENTDYGIQIINSILIDINKLQPTDDYSLTLRSGLDGEANLLIEAKSSFFRELTYCLDHCIHDQSLIKIGLLEQKLDYLIDDTFGVAFSTQKYREQCAS
ncbi:MAG: hypothetical protein P8O04_07125 [Flavobacteriaceae bacterium]|nr:hypothetical protein [Flavobacteriaceae bacterium]